MIEVLYVILGFTVIFVSGFLLSLIFYPGRGDLDFWERVGVSLGLGVLALVFIAVILAQPGMRALKAGPFFGSVAALSAACAILTYWRGSLRWVIALIRRPKPKPEVPRPEEPISEGPPEEPKPEPPEEEGPPEEPAREGPAQEGQGERREGEESPQGFVGAIPTKKKADATREIDTVVYEEG